MKKLLLSLLLLTSSTAAAQEGWGVASTPAGRIYFTDIPRNIVWRIERDGSVAIALAATHSHALVTIGDGFVYGTHGNATAPIRSAWRIDGDGGVHTMLPPTRDLPLGLQSFLIDTDGTMYSGAGTPNQGGVLLRRRPDGVIERVAEGFESIDGMAWTPDGAIFLTDGPYLKRVTLDGTVETLGGGPITQTRWGAALMGVTTDGSGGAFVADFSGGRVLDVGRRSGVAVEYVSDFPWSPSGVARDADGLIVLEHLRMPWSMLGNLQVGPYLRVRRLGLKGRVQTLTVLWGTRTGMAGAVIAIIAAGVIAWRIRLQHMVPRRS